MAIRTNGIAILHKPIKAYQFQLLPKASIFILLNLHSISKGTLAKITLTKASVIGSYEYVAILILKKDDPQIIANSISKDKSNVLASLIFNFNRTYVINAYLLYIFNYTLKKLLIYVQCDFKTIII